MRSDEAADGAGGAGAAARRARDGAVRRWRSSTCRCPDMDGLALARAIRAEPALAALPLRAADLRGRARATAEAARAAGIAAYLTKPVRQSQLLRRAEPA